MGGWSGYSDVILGDHAVVEDGDDGWADELIVFEPSTVEDDVVNIPRSGRTGGVYEWGHKSVQGGGLTVGVGFVFVGIEHLDLVFSEEEDPRVTATLSVSGSGLRGGPFDVELDIGSVLACGGEAPSFWGNFDVSVFYFPSGLSVGVVFPHGKVFSIEEDDGVAWSGAWCRLRAVFAGGNDTWLRAFPVVHVPFSPGDNGRVLVAEGFGIRALGVDGCGDDAEGEGGCFEGVHQFMV